MVLNKELKRRFNEIEESVNLGTLDTSILGLMIFVVATALALLSLGFPKILVNQPYVFSGTIIFFVFIIPLFFFICYYAQTIFIKDRRFTNKQLIITYVLNLLILVVLFWTFLFIAWIYERWWITPKLVVQIVTIVIIIITLILAIFKVHPKVKKYFNDNFPNIIQRRLKEISRQSKTRK